MIRNVINFAQIWNHGMFDGVMITCVLVETLMYGFYKIMMIH